MSRVFTNPNVRPPQGTDRMTLVDASGTEYLYYFSNIAEGVIRNASTTVAMTAESSKTVTHNRNYHPIVWVEDASGNKVSVDLTYDSNNAFTVSVGGSFTGTIYYL